jgi:hypothetical protein
MTINSIDGESHRWLLHSVEEITAGPVIEPRGVVVVTAPSVRRPGLGDSYRF